MDEIQLLELGKTFKERIVWLYINDKYIEIQKILQLLIEDREDRIFLLREILSTIGTVEICKLVDGEAILVN